MRRAYTTSSVEPGPADALPGSADAPSKTRLKQQSHDLQKLGLALAGLPDARLASLALPERLLDALLQYRQTRSHEGRRRQLQYVGKLMREVDPGPLREAVAEAQLGSARDTLLLHEAERWRDALLAGDEALTRWLSEHAGCDAQRLRSLVRAARREAALPPEQRSPRSHRELFQFIRPWLAEA
ncbi:MAG TPA: ribosome biogenesis factor YjgA [Rubrivivax sp.]|nr:ribosome biogenesis factor YjgA [Rubrivivax sp.]